MTFACPGCGTLFPTWESVHPRRECTGSKFPLFEGDTPLSDDEVREIGYEPSWDGWKERR